MDQNNTVQNNTPMKMYLKLTRGHSVEHKKAQSQKVYWPPTERYMGKPSDRFYRQNTDWTYLLNYKLNKTEGFSINLFWHNVRIATHACTHTHTNTHTHTHTRTQSTRTRERTHPHKYTHTHTHVHPHTHAPVHTSAAYQRYKKVRVQLLQGWISVLSYAALSPKTTSPFVANFATEAGRPKTIRNAN